MTLLQLNPHLALVWHVLAETVYSRHDPLPLLRISRVALSLTLLVAVGRGEWWRFVAHSNTVHLLLLE